MNQGARKIYRFAEFDVDVRKRMILRDGKPLKINAKAFDLLVVLIENNKNILGKDEILGRVWEGNLIEENNLTVQISKIRKILHDTKDNPRFLKTIPGNGYCFTADVSLLDENADAPENHVESSDKAALIGGNELSQTPKASSKTSYGLIILLTGIIVFAAAFLLTQRNDSKNILFQNIKPQPLTAQSKIKKTAISPDGKYFAYVLAESKGESIWLQQINSPHAIPVVPATEARIWGLTFAPDGKEILYAVFSENNPDLILQRVSTLGGRIEQVKKDVGGFAGFSPDGQKFAFVTSIASRGKTFLKIANADGSEERTLTERNSTTGFEIAGNTISWSPDGSLIAAIVKDETAMKIIGLNSNNGGLQEICGKYWTKVRDVAWLRDGSGLILTAAEAHSKPLQLWHIEYPGGEVRQITDDLDSYENLSISADNSILVVRANQSGNLSVANDDGNIEKTETIATQSGGFKGFVWLSANELAFISSADGSNNIWQINIDGSGKKQLTRDANILHEIDFSEAGNYFVFDSDRVGKVNLWRVDADGNSPRRLTEGEGEGFPSISKDGSLVVYQNGVVYGKSGIRKVKPDGTEDREIYPKSGIRPQISPDGKRVAFFLPDNISKTEARWKIVVASLETGEILRKIDFPPTAVQRFLCWTHDGQSIAFVDDKAGESLIIVQPLNESKTFVKFADISGKIESFAWSTDGKKLAVNSSIEFRDAVLIKANN